MLSLDRRQFVLAAIGTARLGGCGRGNTAAGMRYRVEVGDSLSSIARRAGIPVGQLVEANQLRSRHLEPGQVLWLPGIRELPSQHARPEETYQAPTPSTPYRIANRQAWGAASMGSHHDPMNGIRKITLHHTSDIPGMMQRSDRDLVAAVQHYHQHNLGWADIGYHYLIGRDGVVYEGRPVHAQGAHVGGSRNRHNLGVSLVGNFHKDLPTRAQLETTERFLVDQQARYRVRRNDLMAHREVGVTVCPGDQLYGWFDDCRRHV
jgi:murein DD-endopeptidase MepM/ murein hydrolase activator NlpD